MNPPEIAWALVSGGKDSKATALYLDEIGKLKGVIYLDTGISVPFQEDFVRDFANRHSFIFEVYKTTESYEDYVRRYGFPHYGLHSVFVSALKGRGMRQFHKKHPNEWAASGLTSSHC